MKGPDYDTDSANPYSKLLRNDEEEVVFAARLLRPWGGARRDYGSYRGLCRHPVEPSQARKRARITWGTGWL